VSDAAVGVLAEGAGGVIVARAIQARLPKEDVAVLADHAYAPYAARSARVVAARAPALAAELAGDGIKLLVVASLQLGEDALAAVAEAAAVPTLALDATLPYAARRVDAERIAAIWADGTLRAVPWLQKHRFERGGTEVLPFPWRGLAEAIEAGRRPGRLWRDRRRARAPAARADAGARPTEAGRPDPAAELAPGAGAGRAARPARDHLAEPTDPSQPGSRTRYRTAPLPHTSCAHRCRSRDPRVFRAP
jgi:glutamate racemase